ncbi:cytochrome P450 [Cylindrobasidium torrendii FP15055 ss-10]|uniref:Cytochrome P450 n=1 Tax=Cylindrobasidium torrendii FP15055 ss-10 TaxID=1314674 RepID=A0A0D7BCN5_9AGAR|nr:cytochrome P450 [Cylindrobasidium torrendii FP15055 ss-10]
MSTSVAAGLALCALLAYLTYWLLFRVARKGSRLRGPPSPSSWLLGHEIELLKQTTAGELERQWTEEYGTVTRLSSFAGQTTFFLSDPKGLQYVLNEKVNNTPKGGDNDLFGTALMGKGLTVVSGQAHLRQRRVLMPAFSTSMTREWAELFQDHGDKMMEKIKSQAEENPSVNILEWTTKFALDVLGLSGFRHQFGAINGENVPITQELRDALYV